MILPSDETELSTKGQPDEENSLSTKESFTGTIGVTIGDLDKYKKDSLINIWKDANAYYSSGEEWTDEDAEFFDELAVRINTATEEGMGSVSGPAVSMIANNNYKEDEAMTMPSESNEEGGNPNHDSSNGQFTSGSGGSSDKKTDSDKPKKVNIAQKEHDDNMKVYNDEMKEYNLKKNIDKHIKDYDKGIINIIRNNRIDTDRYGVGDLVTWFNDNRSKGERKITSDKVSSIIKKMKKLDIIKIDTYSKWNAWGNSTVEYYAISDGYDIMKKNITEPVKPVKRRGDTSQASMKGVLSSVKKNDEEGAFNKLEQINSKRDFIKDGHYIIEDEWGSRPATVKLLHPSKRDMKYPEAPKEDGNYYEWQPNDFKVDGKMVKVGDTISFDDHDGRTEVIVSDFSYDGDAWEGPSVNGYVSWSSSPSKFPRGKQKGHGGNRIDDVRSIVSSSDVKMKDGNEVLDNILLNETYIQDQFGVFYRPVYVGENYKDHETDLVFEGKLYTTEGVGNCPFCKGAGKVTVEKLGLKDCPDCDGTGDIQGEQEMPPQEMPPQEMPQEEVPVEEEKPNPFAKGGESKVKAVEKTVLEVAKYYEGDQSFEQQFQEWIDPNNYESSDGYKDATGGRVGDDEHSRTEFAKQLGYGIDSDWYMGYEEDRKLNGESKANEWSSYDMTNPNRDLSDPNWISRGASHAEQRDEMATRQANADRYEREKDIVKVVVCGKSECPKVFPFDKFGNTDKWEQHMRNDHGAGDGQHYNQVSDIMNMAYQRNYMKIREQRSGDVLVESYTKESCGCKTKGLEASISKYEKFVRTEINILKKRANEGESVGLMYGLPTVRKDGKKIKGTLAYAGVSLNDRIYLPEELAKGHGKTLPLLLNHSSTAGAEEEMDRLDGEMRDHLENEKDYEVGEVTLTWDADKLTLFYEGVIENEFFQKEVDEMDMAVSLGIFYDSNSPQVCDENCYTLIKGAEFREVSLVYHAGFPIATIEAVESKLKRASIKDIKSKANERVVAEITKYQCRCGEIFDTMEDISDHEYFMSDSMGDRNHNTVTTINTTEIIQESLANEDSLVKIEDNEDADTQVTVLDEWKNETDPDVDGETKGIRTTEEAIAEEEEDEMPLGGSIDAEPKETDTVEQPIIVESVRSQSDFSVRGVSGMTISNTNGVEKYSFDPTQNYETNTVHFSVTEKGGTIFGEEIQMQPKMTTPEELTKEIESKPNVVFTDADEDILKKN